MALGGRQALWLAGNLYNRKQAARGNLWRWYCSRYHRGCKAVAITTKELEAVQYLGDHDHLPPNLMNSAAGYLIMN